MCKDVPPVGVDAGHADHGARETSSRLVRHVGSVNHRSDVMEDFFVGQPPTELQRPVLYPGLQDDLV